ncbi:hypothetical protein EIMP300_74120 [Escherichia coli]|uniref:EAL domain-containing protein n=1 Tax=Escherichia coli TaxID=562 RepID=A0A8S0G068_ECOLX|nr:hypothetical protein EIMP300_74120 [Escherichia coli]
MGDWLRQHPQHPQQHISINLESTVLTSEKIPQLLREMINHYQVNPRQIALELTEREFADPKTSAPIISRYREAGHEIYLDDFGTGYSSLSYLQDLDVDILKIDKSFVDALEYKNVTPHIIEMAKTLKLKMVAEGIETSKQRRVATPAWRALRSGLALQQGITERGFLTLGRATFVNYRADGTPHSPSRYLLVDD